MSLYSGDLGHNYFLRLETARKSTTKYYPHPGPARKNKYFLDYFPDFFRAGLRAGSNHYGLVGSIKCMSSLEKLHLPCIYFEDWYFCSQAVNSKVIYV